MPLTVPVGETAPVGAQAMALAGEMATTPVLDGATVPVTALETALARETAPALAQDGAKAQAPAGAPAVAGATAPATAPATVSDEDYDDLLVDDLVLPTINTSDFDLVSFADEGDLYLRRR